MTREEAIKKFRQHWNAIANSDHYFCDKDDTEIYIYTLDADCFLCEYILFEDCSLFPIDLRTGYCINKNSPYRKWSKCIRWDISHLLLPSAAKVLARKIANLPEKDNC